MRPTPRHFTYLINYPAYLQQVRPNPRSGGKFLIIGVNMKTVLQLVPVRAMAQLDSSVMKAYLCWKFEILFPQSQHLACGLPTWQQKDSLYSQLSHFLPSFISRRISISVSWEAPLAKRRLPERETRNTDISDVIVFGAQVMTETG